MKAPHKDYLKRYYRKNRKVLLTKSKKYAKAHKDEIRKYQKDYALKNKKKVHLIKKRWFEKNRQRQKQQHQKWMARHPERYRASAHAAWHKRRARLIDSTVNPRSIQLFILGVRKSKLVNCYYCQELTPGRSAHIDHVIPLSKGGPHSVENLCATCPKCNLSKHDSLIQDWMRLGQQVLAL